MKLFSYRSAGLIPFAALSLASATPVYSQNLIQDHDPMVSGPPSPSDRFDTLSKGITVALDIAEKKAEASASIGGHLAVATIDSGGVQLQDAVLWKLGVQLPISGQSDLFDDPTLDVLKDGLKLSGSLTWKHYRSDPSKIESKDYLDLLDRAREACVVNALTEAAKEQCRNDRIRFPSESYIREHLSNADIEIARALCSGFYTLGIAGNIGIKNFGYTTTGTLAKTKDTKESFSLTATGVYYPSNAVSAWKLEAEYGESYEALDQITVCKDVIVEPKDDCVFDSPGKPTRTESFVIRGEFRRYFPLNNSERGIGIAPLISVDTLSGDLGAELPIFYHLGGKAPVAPGIKFGYKKDKSKMENEDETFTVAVFLKTSFGF